MSSAIHPSVKIHETYDNVIVFEDINGYRLNYRISDGVLVPGNVWTMYHSPYNVHMFVGMGQFDIPEILKIEDTTHPDDKLPRYQCPWCESKVLISDMKTHTEYHNTRGDIKKPE
jgi:hypothetical protein